MNNKVEIGLIRTGEISMYLNKYAELIETIERHFGIRYSGHDDSKKPREIAEWLYAEGAKVEALMALRKDGGNV